MQGNEIELRQVLALAEFCETFIGNSGRCAGMRRHFPGGNRV